MDCNCGINLLIVLFLFTSLHICEWSSGVAISSIKTRNWIKQIQHHRCLWNFLDQVSSKLEVVWLQFQNNLQLGRQAPPGLPPTGSGPPGLPPTGSGSPGSLPPTAPAGSTIPSTLPSTVPSSTVPISSSTVGIPQTTAPFTGSVPAVLNTAAPDARGAAAPAQINPVKFPDSG